MASTPGSLMVRANLVGTLVFGVTATYAAAVFDSLAQWVGAITAMVLFAIGVFVFIWSYWTAVQRSRTEQIAVSQLYLLLGSAIPPRVRVTMNLALVAQFGIALATALVRPNGPDGNPGSSLAVGFLVPMFGFGLNGLWAATHGRFEPRADAMDPTGSGSPAALTESGDQIGQNADHG
jgi:hypothetical protein